VGSILRAREALSKAKTSALWWYAPSAMLPHAPGLSYSHPFTARLRHGPVFDPLLSHLKLPGFKHFMIGPTLGRGSNPAHGDAKPKSAAT
jgi:hypothetical protein